MTLFRSLFNAAATAAAMAATLGAASSALAASDPALIQRGAYTDAAQVLATYGEFPDRCADVLRGGFAAAIWDARRRRLTVVRDALGLHPCFYWWNGRALVVAPSVDAVLGCSEVDRAFDRTTIAEYLQNRTAFADPHETFYARVRRLPPAARARFGSQHCMPPASPHAATAPPCRSIESRGFHAIDDGARARLVRSRL